jgi:hypothetical protein
MCTLKIFRLYVTVDSGKCLWNTKQPRNTLVTASKRDKSLVTRKQVGNEEHGYLQFMTCEILLCHKKRNFGGAHNKTVKYEIFYIEMMHSKSFYQVLLNNSYLIVLHSI